MVNGLMDISLFAEAHCSSSTLEPRGSCCFKKSASEEAVNLGRKGDALKLFHLFYFTLNEKGLQR